MFEEYRDILLQTMSEETNGRDKVDLFFSAGMDSLVLFFSLKNLEKNFICQTFYLNPLSRDLKYSKIVCDNSGIEQIITQIPQLSLQETRHNIGLLMTEIKSCRKTHIETIYPFIFCRPKIISDAVIMGFDFDITGDGKKESIKFRKDETPERFKKEILENLNNPNKSGGGQLRAYLKNTEKTLITPYKNNLIINYITQFTWRQINSPKQKMPSYIAFKKEIDELNLYRRNSPSQIESGVRDHFLKVFGCTKVYEIQKIYREIYKEYVA